MCVLDYSFSESATNPRARQVCDNVGDHLIGNVYARYEWETEAQTAVDSLNDRWYAGAYFRAVDGRVILDLPPPCRPTVIRGALSRYGFPRSMLPTERERRV